jgi:multicomponent Na+:H+ antiporter subunit E
MNVLFINVLLALVWTFLTGSFTPNTLIEGFIAGYLIMWLASPLYGETAYFKKFRQIVSLLLFFAWEMFVSTLRVASVVISPNLDIQPGIVAVPLDVKKDVEIMLLANLITVTPGSLSLDISYDRRVIYIHVMHVTDVEAYRREIKQGFEKRIGELFQ